MSLGLVPNQTRLRIREIGERRRIGDIQGRMKSRKRCLLPESIDGESGTCGGEEAYSKRLGGMASFSTEFAWPCWNVRFMNQEVERDRRSRPRGVGEVGGKD